jgi:hypothetical protein
MPASERFQQLALRFTDPVQYDYEVIRGIFLADESIAERSRETGQDRATVTAKARRFLEEGMLGLIDRRASSKKGQYSYPENVAGYLLYLKQLYPPLHDRELTRIVGRGGDRHRAALADRGDGGRSGALRHRPDPHLADRPRVLSRLSAVDHTHLSLGAGGTRNLSRAAAAQRAAAQLDGVLVVEATAQVTLDARPSQPGVVGCVRRHSRMGVCEQASRRRSRTSRLTPGAEAFRRATPKTRKHLGAPGVKLEAVRIGQPDQARRVVNHPQGTRLCRCLGHFGVIGRPTRHDGACSGRSRR